MEKNPRYFITFAYGKLSLLELLAVHEARVFDFEIISSSDFGAIVSCKESSARALIKRVGGSYKIARVFSSYDEEEEESFKEIYLPDSNKFNWTLSSYNADEQVYERVKESAREYLKKKGLGKAKFLEPAISDSDLTRELPIADLNRRVIVGDQEDGLDLVYFGGIGKLQGGIGQTIAISDITRYEKSDFERPYQDPTLTISPRLARVLVNLALKEPKGRLLDPFCGLGTILQEALGTGCSVLGIDKNFEMVRKASINIEWYRKQYGIPSRIDSRILRSDSSSLSKIIVGTVDAIATEPILLPRFEANPSPKSVVTLIDKARERYHEAIASMSGLLSGKGSRIAISSPVIVTSDGKAHSFQIDTARFNRLKLYQPSSFRFEYPLNIKTSKKKIVRRAITVLAAS